MLAVFSSRFRLILLAGGLCAGSLLVGCQSSRVEETPPDVVGAPKLEGEWLMLDIRPEVAFRKDPSVLMYQRLSWIANVRPLWRGTVQMPRWIFQKNGEILVRWPTAGTYQGRHKPGGTWHRSWRTHEYTIRSKAGNPEQPLKFKGDTMIVSDPATHLETRLLPVY